SVFRRRCSHLPHGDSFRQRLRDTPRPCFRRASVRHFQQNPVNPSFAPHGSLRFRDIHHDRGLVPVRIRIRPRNRVLLRSVVDHKPNLFSSFSSQALAHPHVLFPSRQIL